MKHHSAQEIAAAATLYPSPQEPRMSRRQRIERWAALLESHSGTLNALRQIEYLSPADRRAYRAPNTPLTIAFNDPVLREEGLKSDGLGDAMTFFEMNDSDAHRLLCDCRYLGRMTGTAVAERLRRYAASGERRAKLRQAIRRFFGL
ncbi:hypothetical protein [Chelativorans intermedius]|uniref:Uncharacterized protein n=1 Tax=Chelativorans intermedius TaxID=515947 RepID=A0ABV6D6H2_9HYPH|nr:hypothetical protein [Chelativorans intermedius]MCT8999478.1 hypothetical protein [Chelativorans intermedius]